MSPSTEEITVQASTATNQAIKVADEARMGILPKYAGRRMIFVEASVFDFMRKLTDGQYTGGYWHMFELPGESGFFMVPDTEREDFDVLWPDNFYQGKMSPEAAGITACLYAFSHVAHATGDEKIEDLFYALREFAMGHPEAGEIMGAID